MEFTHISHHYTSNNSNRTVCTQRMLILHIRLVQPPNCNVKPTMRPYVGMYVCA